MNKKNLILAVLVLVVILVALVLIRPKTAAYAVTYECSDGYNIKAEMTESEAVVTLPGGESFELERVKNASGNRYRSSDGLNEFWDQDGEAILRVGEDISFDSCIEKNSEDLASDLGNRSNWSRFVSETLAGDFRFAIEHPEKVRAKKISDGVKFNYSSKKTGEFDINITVTDSTVDETTLSQAGIEDVEKIIFAGKDAYNYVNEDGYLVLAIVLDDKTSAEVTYKVSGTTEVEQAVGEMLSSLIFGSSTEIVESAEESVSTVAIALLKPATGTPTNGCDDVVLVDRSILPTTDSLSAAISLLFSLDTLEFPEGSNFIPKTTDTLKFSNATLVGNQANIYLTGQLSGIAGVCDNPRAQIQIEETAKQINGVESVQLYLNGQAVDNLYEAEGARG